MNLLTQNLPDDSFGSGCALTCLIFVNSYSPIRISKLSLGGSA
jgi:hypothetical protein